MKAVTTGRAKKADEWRKKHFKKRQKALDKGRQA
jgi:hypothetical protein